MEDILVQSHHRKTAWNRCKFKHWIHYELKKRKPRNNIDFIFGESIHDALRLYYSHNRDISLESVVKQFQLKMQVQTEDTTLSLSIEAWTKIGTTLLSRYYDKTKEVETFVAIDTELSFSLCLREDGYIICNSRDIPKETFTVLAGKIDLVVDTPDGIYVVDHKTTRLSHENFMEHFNIDEQLLDYSIWGRYTYGDKFKGVMVNGVNKDMASRDTIFRRWFGFTDDEIDYAISSYLDSAQEYYILKQAPHLMEQRQVQFDCQRCEDLDVSMAARKSQDFHTLLDLYYEDIENFDWEE